MRMQKPARQPWSAVFIAMGIMAAGILGGILLIFSLNLRNPNALPVSNPRTLLGAAAGENAEEQGQLYSLHRNRGIFFTPDLISIVNINEEENIFPFKFACGESMVEGNILTYPQIQGSYLRSKYVDMDGMYAVYHLDRDAYYPAASAEFFADEGLREDAWIDITYENAGEYIDLDKPLHAQKSSCVTMSIAASIVTVLFFLIAGVLWLVERKRVS